jgi:F0F1-type ATP synthase membrane subunit b/b'
MVKPTYLLFAVLTFVIFLAILVAFVAGPDSGPFDSGTTPSQVQSK